MINCSDTDLQTNIEKTHNSTNTKFHLILKGTSNQENTSQALPTPPIVVTTCLRLQESKHPLKASEVYKYSNLILQSSCLLNTWEWAYKIKCKDLFLFKLWLSSSFCPFFHFNLLFYLLFPLLSKIWNNLKAKYFHQIIRPFEENMLHSTFFFTKRKESKFASDCRSFSRMSRQSFWNVCVGWKASA